MTPVPELTAKPNFRAKLQRPLHQYQSPVAEQATRLMHTDRRPGEPILAEHQTIRPCFGTMFKSSDASIV